MKKSIFSLMVLLISVSAMTFAQTEIDSTFKADQYVTVKLDSTVIVNNTIVQVFYHTIDVTPRISGPQSITYDQLQKNLDQLGILKRLRKGTLDYQASFIRDSVPGANPISKEEMERNDAELSQIIREHRKYKGLSEFFNK